MTMMSRYWRILFIVLCLQYLWLEVLYAAGEPDPDPPIEPPTGDSSVYFGVALDDTGSSTPSNVSDTSMGSPYLAPYDGWIIGGRDTLWFYGTTQTTGGAIDFKGCIYDVDNVLRPDTMLRTVGGARHCTTTVRAIADADSAYAWYGLAFKVGDTFRIKARTRYMITIRADAADGKGFGKTKAAGYPRYYYREVRTFATDFEDWWNPFSAGNTLRLLVRVKYTWNPVQPRIFTGTTLCEDNYTSSNAANVNTNYGTSTILSWGYQISPYFHPTFRLSSIPTDSIPLTAIRDSVFLELWLSSVGGTATYHMYRRLKPYFELLETHNDWYTTDSEWTTPGAASTGTTYNRGDGTGDDRSSAAVATIALTSANQSNWVRFKIDMTDSLTWGVIGVDDANAQIQCKSSEGDSVPKWFLYYHVPETGPPLGVHSIEGAGVVHSISGATVRNGP